MGKFRILKLFNVGCLLAGMLIVIACGESRETNTEKKVLSSSPPNYSDIPNCAGMGKILADLVGGLTPSDDDELGRYRNDTGYGVTCVWLSKNATDSSPFKVVKGGSFAVTLNIGQKENFDENELRKLGMIYDDPRIQRIGGYIVDIGKDFDLADQVGSAGPLVVLGTMTISFNATGLYLQKVEEMGPITNERAIAGVVKLHKIIIAKEGYIN